MIDRQRRRGSAERGDRRQWHEVAIGTGDVEGVQRLGVLPELRCHFHHDAILIETRVHRRDLALTERVVQRLINRASADTQPRGRVPVDDDAGLQSAVLLVAVDVGDDRLALQACQQAGCPAVQCIEVVSLQRVLILSVGTTSADTDVLSGLKDHGGSRIVGKLRPDARDHLIGRDLTLRERLQCNEQARLVAGRAAAREGDY